MAYTAVCHKEVEVEVEVEVAIDEVMHHMHLDTCHISRRALANMSSSGKHVFLLIMRRPWP